MSLSYTGSRYKGPSYAEQNVTGTAKIDTTELQPMSQPEIDPGNKFFQIHLNAEEKIPRPGVLFLHLKTDFFTEGNKAKKKLELDTR